MKKKFLLLTSLGLMSTTALGVFAISRTKQLEPFRVGAYPVVTISSITIWYSC